MRPVHLIIPFALALGATAAPYVARAQIGVDVAVTVAPPELPVYDQPPLPAVGYVFTPGYWAYGYSGYYWVPGTWVEPPQPGLLWTPGYWGWNGGQYIFNAGYWGPTVGFYGGINYGFGYGGFGYDGGYWRGGSFFYNHAVSNFGGVRVTNVYEKNVTNVTINRYSFNGPNGVTRRANADELAAARVPHVPPTAMQTQHIQAAQQNHALLASVNHGRPAAAATARPVSSPTNTVASGGRGASGSSPAPHPVSHSSTTRRMPGQDRGVSASPAPLPRPLPHSATPHPVAQSAATHAVAAPREPAFQPPASPMHAPGGPSPSRASIPHPAQPPHTAAPAPREEKPK